jgi:RIO kinase 1
MHVAAFELEEKFIKLLEPYQKRIKDANDRKVYDQFFDRRTLLSLYELMNDGIIATLDFPVATGKEGGVFRATSAEGRPLALKIYRITNATFKSLGRYIEGDERFRGFSKNFTKIVHLWVQREFSNLQRYRKANLSVPEPIARRDNLLAMEYLGDENGPAPLLKDVELGEEAVRYYEATVDFMRRGFRDAGLVHADLSQYNIMVHNNKAYFIDCSQAVTTRHPNALDLLARDVKNINRFFASKGVEVIENNMLIQKITGGEGAVSEDTA